MSDPILESIVGNAPQGLFRERTAEDNARSGGPYGVGTWKARTLEEVIRYAKSDKGFGYRVGLKTFLKDDHKLEYTLKLDLPRELASNGHEVEEWMLNKEAKKMALLNDALGALGATFAVDQAIDSDEQYDTLVNVLVQLIGNKFDCKIVEDGKNVFVPSEDGEQTNREGQKGSWAFESNGFSRVAWIRPSRTR